jgi:hypothetical protein
MRAACGAICLAGSLLMGETAKATEFGLSEYILGLTLPISGYTPPPGVYFLDTFVLYRPPRDRPHGNVATAVAYALRSTSCPQGVRLRHVPWANSPMPDARPRAPPLMPGPPHAQPHAPGRTAYPMPVFERAASGHRGGCRAWLHAHQSMGERCHQIHGSLYRRKRKRPLPTESSGQRGQAHHLPQSSGQQASPSSPLSGPMGGESKWKVYNRDSRVLSYPDYRDYRDWPWRIDRTSRQCRVFPEHIFPPARWRLLHRHTNAEAIWAVGL